MGGIGSGRRCWHFNAKTTTSDYFPIDVRELKREGLLAPHQSFQSQWLRKGKVVESVRIHTGVDMLVLSCRYRSRGDDLNDDVYPIFLRSTPCTLGGNRPWFICPVRDCGRRVAILYGGRIFACRQCYQLVYQSQRDPDYDRAARRADRIRKKLRWEPGIFNDRGWRPKAMHWSTYKRLTAQHDAFVRVSMIGIARRFNIG